MDRASDRSTRKEKERDRSESKHHHHHSDRSRDRDHDREHKHRHRSRPDGSPDAKHESVERERDRDSEERESRARSSRKRKDHHEEGEDADRKRSRRRFEEDREERKVKDEEGLSDGEGRKARRRREGRRFSDGAKEEDRGTERRFRDKVKEEEMGSLEDSKRDFGNGDRNNGVSEKALAQEPLSVASEISMAPTASSSLPLKVSSITTTENEGVSIIRSDEVHGKSSTDGTTTSTVDRSGSFSLDALAKAKKVLQKRKEISEKLKKLNKITSSSSSEKNLPVASDKDAQKATPSGIGTSSAAPTLATSNLTRLPVGPGTSSVGSSGILPGLNSVPNIEAVKRAQELAAKMGYHQDPDFAPLINMFPGPSAVSEMAVAQRPAKTPVLRLDAQGREIDEHGNVINMPKLTNLSTLKVNINKQKKEAFQILRPELDADTGSVRHFDASLGINKTKLLRPKRMTFQFVEEGKWSKQAEITKIKNQFGEAQSKELKVKQSQLAKAKAEQDDNPNFIAIGERVFKEKKKIVIPEIEWWDKPLLSSGTYTDDGGELKLNMDKITIYVEHPRPIEPPAEPAPPPPQPLKLTKKEQKKLRTQRRLAKEKDRQEMIRQGLLEPPKAKIKMSNLMKVLGSEATQDPTRLEMEVRSAAAEREQAHVDRNIARKLTPAERREKKEKKLFEDPNTLETLVSVYKIKDLSHPQTRFKVDVNAQENRLTGCTVISDGISVVVVEGGKKSIKRYGKLMLKRINWAAAVSTEEDVAENAEAPINSCVLVWQGSVAKPSFNRFLVHQCRSDAAARKVFADAGVPHYWDLAVNFSDEL
ncbi:protein RDM16-like [Iris pallida]|uniref:Protein RDM16-like n=1 Tax=Iris pallida TaxID=29817 RepID=A0AAX6EMM9_IRIPA|nr:protein RDM16-like [Iris pallida]